MRDLPRRAHGGTCWLERPDLIPPHLLAGNPPRWQPPRSPLLYQYYVKQCRHYNITPAPQWGTTPAHPTGGAQQHESAQKGYAAYGPSGEGQSSQHFQRGGGGGRGGGRGGHGTSHLAMVDWQQTQRLQALDAGVTQDMFDGPRDTPDNPWATFYSEASWRAPLKVADVAGAQALATTRSSQIASLQQQASQQLAAPAEAAAAPPSTAAQALDSLAGAKLAADAIHAAAAEQLQQQVVQARERAPAVQRRPQPEPFGTLPMPLDIPASSLPDPVRLARAGSIAPAIAPDITSWAAA